MVSLNQLNYQIAWEIASYARFDLRRLVRTDSSEQSIFFTHFNYFYLYQHGKILSFHRIETKCFECNSSPSRNPIGVGSIWLFKPDEKGRMKMICSQCKKNLNQIQV